MNAHISIKRDDTLVRTKKKVMGKANLGKPLEYLINRSVNYYDMKGKILHNFHDKPKKHVLENRKLLCDKWFITSGGTFVLMELKITRNGTNLPFANIERHQIENLDRLDSSKTAHRGWLIVWFKNGRQNLGVYAISGIILDYLVNKYGVLCEHYDIETNIKNRRSISLKDIIYLNGLTDKIQYLYFKKVVNPLNMKEEDILVLDPLWGDK